MSTVQESEARLVRQDRVFQSLERDRSSEKQEPGSWSRSLGRERSSEKQEPSLQGTASLGHLMLDSTSSLDWPGGVEEDTEVGNMEL